jgi:predicted Zn-dependent peptidase
MMNFKQAEIQMSSITPLPTPTKGKADWRNYKAFQLENGVTCLVINDKESKTTAMSCVVNVGASADPREMSGLAHFCEHMWYVFGTDRINTNICAHVLVSLIDVLFHIVLVSLGLRNILAKTNTSAIWLHMVDVPTHPHLCILPTTNLK